MAVLCPCSAAGIGCFTGDAKLGPLRSSRDQPSAARHPYCLGGVRARHGIRSEPVGAGPSAPGLAPRPMILGKDTVTTMAGNSPHCPELSKIKVAG